MYQEGTLFHSKKVLTKIQAVMVFWGVEMAENRKIYHVTDTLGSNLSFATQGLNWCPVIISIRQQVTSRLYCIIGCD